MCSRTWAGPLVDAAGAVPDLVDDHRRAPVDLDDDPQAIGQGLLDGFGLGRAGEGKGDTHDEGQYFHS